ANRRFQVDDADARCCLPETDETIGLGERQRPQQHAVDDAVDRGVGADGESERQHGTGREQERGDEPSAGVPHVASRLLQPAKGTRLAICLTQAGYVTEVLSRGASRPGRIHSLTDELLCGFVDVRGDLLLEVPIRTPVACEPEQTREEDPEAGHEPSSWMLRKRETMSVACCQSAS